MAKLKMKVTKSKHMNPVTKKRGYSARVLTNGTADYSDIAEDAAEDTTFNVDEIRAASGIFIRAAAKALKQGFIVDLGPLGKIYPSCTSGWFENAEDLTLDSVKPTIYYRPSQEVEAAIKGASLVWAKAGEAEDAEQSGTVSPSTGEDNSGGSSNSGGDNNGGGDDPDNGME